MKTSHTHAACHSRFLATLGLLVLALASGVGRAATTYDLQDYYYPLVQGNVWIYKNTSGDAGDMLRSVTAAATNIVCYSGRTHPTPHNVTVAAVYGDNGTWNGADSFTSNGDLGSLWVDYMAAGASYGSYGADYYHESGQPTQERLGYPVPLTSAMSEGQSISGPSDVYTNGVLMGVVSETFELVGVEGVTLFNGDQWPDCLHLRLQVAGSATADNDEWWAKRLGVVKKIQRVSWGTNTFELAYSSVVPNPPLLTFTAPRAGQQFTNAACPVTGAASGTPAVASVSVRANAGNWVHASGTTAWSAVVTLAPGTNTLYAYAVDTGGNASPTNALGPVVLKAQLPIHLAGPGTVQITGGGINQTFSSDKAPWLVPGQTYSLKAATTKPGFGFAGWSGSLTGTNATAPLTLATDMSVTARFVDIKPPVCVVTYPAVGAKLTSAGITVKGGASDNVGVTNVWCWFNGTNQLTVQTANHWASWTASATLAPGTNTIQAYAMDAAGNRSLTNTVKFTYAVVQPPDWAPSSISGMSAVLTSPGFASSTVVFGATNYSSSGKNNEVGAYTYTKVDATTAHLTRIPTAPPSRAGDGATNVVLTFTATDRAEYVSTKPDGTTDTGALSFSAAASTAPDSLAGRTAIEAYPGGSSTLVFSNGTFTVTSQSGNVRSGSYAYTLYSPVGGMIVATYTTGDLAGSVAYVVVTFSSANAADFYHETYNASGTETDSGSGTFRFR
jgi:hypothetical protein